MQLIDPPTLINNFMVLAFTIIQSMLAVPDALPYDAIKEGRWNEAWERILKALVSFDEPYWVADYSEPLLHDTKPVNDDTECTSKDATITLTCMSRSEHREFTAFSAPHVNLNAAGFQNQNASTLPDASCASASPLVSDERLSFLSSPNTSTTLQPLSRTNVMTGGPEVKPVESVHEQLCVDSHIVCEEDLETLDSHPFVCSCFICEEDRENDTLLDLRLDGRNIVLDSLYPDIAPHIVITPPVSCADDFYTPHQNRVDPQWPCFLNVPRLSPHMFYHHCPLPSSHDESAGCHLKEFHSQSAASSDDLGVIRPRTTPRVFNNKKLLLAVEASSIERLVFREIVDGIFRHRRKAVAFEASLSASAVCARFNKSVAASQLEQPFVWTDPAQPILLTCRKFSGVSIIESDCPFRAPHIVIIAAEPHDPWISWSNRVEDQDYEYLPVYPKRSSTPPINSASLPIASVPGEHQGDPDSNGFIQSHSDPSRECYLTGLPPSFDESGCFLTPHEKGRTTYTDHPHSVPDVNEITESEPMSLGLSIIRCETPTPDSDDEDDLPPFDDWYLSVIERSKAIGA